MTMKIAVYTICKNEAGFIKKWVDSAKDANYLLILDTGSTDETIPILKEASKIVPVLNFQTVSINPWRFDEARNVSLHLLPEDIDVCICLDMDEVLVPCWREIVEREWTQNLDRLRYNYIWSWNEDGSPGVTYHADKIHARHGFRWVNPVHEVLRKDFRLSSENQKFIKDTLIEHYPDTSKSRSGYLDLLALAVKEDPNNDRNAHYYARDLMFASHLNEAIEEFKRHLSLPSATWVSERAASMRYIGDCYWAFGDYGQATEWFQKAIEEAPFEREPYIALAQAYRFLGNLDGVIANCEAALAITEKPNTYINQPSAWSDWPKQMLEEARAAKHNTKH